MQQLEEKVTALQNVINALESEKAAADKKNGDLRVIYLRQESASSQLRRKINELEADNETLRDNIGELYIINSTLRNNVAAMSANVEQWAKHASEETDQLDKLNLYTDKVESQLQSKEIEAAELGARVKDLEACNDNLTERNEDLEERLTTKKIKAQAFKAEYDELERKNEALWRTITYLDEVVEEDQMEVMRLRQGVLCLKKIWESNEQQ
ncbi:uncharacterized protein M437DRAFT_43653 [Aureobasidium melanogenum CBS 110374]|uniref:Uncharacterized protein n=1 Tax=Aureobasidium melanogenum (strain CBS 110374) TaxID=1043003 RepID=A0A074W4T9_AURM1|nr:uncharacterized protein M437DRAFT_43653 [Aureobasidium melanogenum CBS 110374]KEQ64957.1 hypothetical protein M437DRAFT_43653 [Aureobasidium melanogenum CBS 110374]